MASKRDTITDPVLKAGDGNVLPQPLYEAALAALKPFAHLPIRDDQPDDAHPAFQVNVGFVRAARACFPEDFPVAAKGPDTELREAIDKLAAEGSEPSAGNEVETTGFVQEA